MALFKADNIAFSYSKDKEYIRNLSLEIEHKDFITVTGKNGSGKSTLVKLLAGIIPPDEGKIYFEGKDIFSIKRKELAVNLSYLPQYGIPFYEGMRVGEFLMLGRYPYRSSNSFFENKCDVNSVNEALEFSGISKLKLKLVSELSGGERQKVLITLSLIQLDINSELNKKILIIDEPLTYLDIHHQYEIFEMLSLLNRNFGLTILVITHDLNIALRFSEKTVLMQDGKIVQFGMTNDVLTEETLKKHFLINSQIVKLNDISQIYYNINEYSK
jgi:iron complex transport system ATP-binding protein